MPLRIAIDASRTTAAQPTGTEYYALRLIQALLDANEGRQSPFRFTLFFRDRPPDRLFQSSAQVEKVVIPFPRLWTHIRFAAALWKLKPDITFVPAHTLPFLFPGKSIVTVHDLGYKHYPSSHPARQRAYLDTTTRFSQARATTVLADSQATARDLYRFYGASPDKIQVVYPGVDAAQLSASDEQVEAAREKYGLPQRYFLVLGTLQPRKNIQRIVKAFAHWQDATNDRETALVLAGGRGWLFDEKWLNGVPNVKLTGYIDEADKGGLLRGAIALVFPSLYEGFGFPAVEAMICGRPVIASNTSSLPEIVGDCGLLVDPLKVEEIADAMRKCSDDDSLRQDLIARGQARAKHFSWQAAAERVMDAFEALGERS